MIRFYKPQAQKQEKEPGRDNSATAEIWGEIPDPGEPPVIIRTPQKKEKHWIVECIPLWILMIVVFAFLVWGRHLTAYVDGKKVIDISYRLLLRKR